MVGREVVETAAALVALLAALLVVGRYRSSSRLRDLLLVQAFLVLAVTNTLPTLLPALLDVGASSTELRVRLVLVGGVVAAGSMALAGIAGEARLAGRTISPLFAVGTGLVTPAVGMVLLEALEVGTGENGTVRVLHAAAAALFGIAAVAFGLRHSHLDDRFRQYVAVGCLVAATARLTLVASPAAVASDRTQVFDVLRLFFYGVLLAGAVEEIRGYWQRVAILEERRRLARDLHDGVAQELAFIATEAKRQHPRSDQLARIASSAQRALDESRRAISALSRPLDQPLEEAVAEAASELALRAGTSLRLDLARGIALPSEQRDELVRILREALTNAVNHGNASTIRVDLHRGDDVITLRVTDDGIGFVDTTASPPGHFGLATMRERAARVGAELQLLSSPGVGTSVEVRLRCPA
jgi:signal transduction histidine kinase